MTRVTIALAPFSLLGLACSGPTAATGSTASAAATAQTATATPGAPSARSGAPSATAAASSKVSKTAKCPPADPTFSPTGDYRHKRTRLLVQSQGSPRHAASDVAVRAGSPAAISGKFTYGKAGKDLEDEEISLFVRDESCTWRGVGTGFTDDDGWVKVEIPETLIADPGVYAFQLVVRGDGSRASGNVYAVAPGTPAVVFDVDATLTTSDQEVFEEVLEGKVPEARPKGRDVAQELAERDVVVVYLTGRPYFLGPITRAWLAGHGFPEGLVRTTTQVEQCAPTPAGVGAYKEAALEELKRAGLDFRLAYGNATTDICAYARSGIDPKRTFILGPHAGKGCDGHPVANGLDGYGDHVGKIAELLR